MSTRTYLSIGDVLTLLRQEFPDVTISKIRFLESQGLVDPERSPSGYRKFYDHDVERLRWVLRQQREHFLPLRVIRDRLNRAGNGVPPDEPPAAGGSAIATASGTPDPDESGVGRRPQSGPADAGAPGAASRPEAGHGPLAARVATVTAARMAPEGNGAVVHVDEPPSRSGAGGDEPVAWPGGAEPTGAATAEAPGDRRTAGAGRLDRPASPAGDQGAGGERPPANAQGSASTGHEGEGQAHPGSRPAAGHDDDPTPAHAAPGPMTEPADRPPAHAAGTSGPHGGPKTASEAPAAGPVPSSSMPAAEAGTSLTLDELCESSGLTASAVSALESFGLVEPVHVGGATYYDDDAVTVAKLAAELGRYGIEPRHLRVYRNAVEREVGLVEQVVMPLLRQRNPAARQRAVDAAAELTRLGEGLRACLLRRELRRQLGT